MKRASFYLDIADQMGWEPEYGPCAKVRVFCTITAADGGVFIGENHCALPQDTCPRAPGEDYTKCKTICRQEGHAELVALRLAGDAAKGARATFKNHTYACRPCQEALFAAGVLSIGPEAEAPTDGPFTDDLRALGRAVVALADWHDAKNAGVK